MERDLATGDIRLNGLEIAALDKGVPSFDRRREAYPLSYISNLLLDAELARETLEDRMAKMPLSKGDIELGEAEGLAKNLIALDSLIDQLDETAEALTSAPMGIAAVEEYLRTQS